MSNTKSNNPVPNFYRASAGDFKKIPGSPIAYWVNEKIREIFHNFPLIEKVIEAKVGLQTGDDSKFLRLWWEPKNLDTRFPIRYNNFLYKQSKWIPCNKGGEFRKWYGNHFFLVNWENNGEEIKKFSGSVIRNPDFYFRESVSWSEITSSSTSFRYFPEGFIFNIKGMNSFPSSNCSIEQLLMFCNSKFVNFINKALNPTISFGVGNFNSLPTVFVEHDIIANSTKKLLKISKTDWNSYETSWDFTTLPLLSPEYLSPTIEASYQELRTHWQEMTNDMLSLEEENNKIFIEAYGLQDELTPDVPLSEITLTCNPHYRYDANKPEEELESLLLADTIKELISYAVGCMVGRYSLDKPGLILANQGETVDDFLIQIPNPSFRPDDDNIIPVLDDEYFTDDIVFRFKDFLKTVFGEKTLSQNLDYIAKVLTGKSSSSPEKVIRDYFLRDFYKDHLRRYKKRPIYWMFSSGKQQGFNALVYMHRYNKATLSKMRTDYLLELEAKLEAELTSLSKDPVKNKARISKIKKQVDEMRTWDELLNNKALALIGIDLDDGVVVNYAKFEGLVRRI